MYSSRVEALQGRKRQRRLQQRKLLRRFVLNTLMLIIFVAVVGGSFYFLSHLPMGDSTNEADIDIEPGQVIEGSITTGSIQTQNKSVVSISSAQSDNLEKVSDAHDGVANEGKEITISFVGDIHFSGKVRNVLDQQGYHYPFTYVKDNLLISDLNIANLETPVTLKETPVPNKEYVYSSHPDALNEMHEAGFHAVNLANNHIMDQGVEGMLDTVSSLEKAEMKSVGVGKDEEQAYQPAIFERNGKTIALLGFSRVLPAASWKAGKNTPGVAQTYQSDQAVEAIKKAKESEDIVIVMVHWGKERLETPVQHQKDLAHAYIDAGADLVIGSHPHVWQGLEQYKGKWIAYSLGNFIFSQSTHEKTWKTGILQTQFSKDGEIKVSIIPYYAELGRAVPMDETESQQWLSHIMNLSPGVSISLNGEVSSIQNK